MRTTQRTILLREPPKSASISHADEEQRLRNHGPYALFGMWKVADSITPLDVALARDPSIAADVEAALDRLEERTDPRNADAMRRIAEQRALVQAARAT